MKAQFSKAQAQHELNSSWKLKAPKGSRLNFFWAWSSTSLIFEKLFNRLRRMSREKKNERRSFFFLIKNWISFLPWSFITFPTRVQLFDAAYPSFYKNSVRAHALDFINRRSGRCSATVKCMPRPEEPWSSGQSSCLWSKRTWVWFQLRLNVFPLLRHKEVGIK